MPADDLFLGDGFLHLRAGRFQEARAALREARAATRDESERALVDIQLESIPILTKAEHPPDVARLAEIGVRKFSERHSFLSSYYLTMHFVGQGELDRAQRYLREMVGNAERTGEVSYASLAYESAADLATARRRYADAKVYSQEAHAAAIGSDAADDLLLIGSILHNIGYASLGTSDYEEAIHYAGQGVKLLESGGFGPYLADVYMTLAFASCAIDHLEDAAAYVSLSETHMAEGHGHVRKYVHYLRGEIAHRRHRDEEASLHFDRLQEYYPELANVAALLSAVDCLSVLMPE